MTPRAAFLVQKHSLPLTPFQSFIMAIVFLLLLLLFLKTENALKLFSSDQKWKWLLACVRSPTRKDLQHFLFTHTASYLNSNRKQQRVVVGDEQRLNHFQDLLICWLTSTKSP